MSKILIVEDEEAIADLEKDYLELSDFEVTIENTGDKGLEAALSENFALEPYLRADFVHLKECALSIETFPLAEEVFSL